LQHGSFPAQRLSSEACKAISVVYHRQSNRIPTMFRDLTGKADQASRMSVIRRAGVLVKVCSIFQRCLLAVKRTERMTVAST
jgi:hypothetical protein